MNRANFLWDILGLEELGAIHWKSLNNAHEKCKHHVANYTHEVATKDNCIGEKLRIRGGNMLLEKKKL